MRLLLATPFWPPGVGGSTRLIVGLCEYLQKNGHEVTVVTYGEPLPTDAPHVVRVPPQEKRGASSRAFAKTVWETLAEKKIERALAYVAYPHAIGVGGACLARRVPYTVLALGEDVSVCSGSLRKTLLLRPALRGARENLAISHFTAQALQKIGGKPVGVVAPGIDPEPYEAVTPDQVVAFRKRHRLMGAKVVLTLARLEPRKGHDKVIEALPALAEAVPCVHYLVVGKGDPEPLRRKAAELGVAHRLTILDFLPDDELPVLFAACDAFAMVSRHDPNSREVEGFGVVYLEAAAAGRPCIAGSHGGAPDAVAHGETGFVVDPGDVEQLSAALWSVLTDSDRASRMGALGRLRVRESFQEAHFFEAVTRSLTC
jgi:glycosyltransferase involved in cell wall biosynthesis